MDQVELRAESRSIVGKRVKQLRAQGIIPLVVYGRKTASANIQAVEFDTRRALARAQGQLIALRIQGEADTRQTLARDVQYDVLSGNVLHVDLYEVDMTETVQVEVSLVLIGEAPPVVTGEMLLNQVLNAVEIECLPGDIVQSIEVDISGLVDSG